MWLTASNHQIVCSVTVTWNRKCSLHLQTDASWLPFCNTPVSPAISRNIIFIYFYFILFYFLTLQYCIGFAIYQNESAAGYKVHAILYLLPRAEELRLLLRSKCPLKVFMSKETLKLKWPIHFIARMLWPVFMGGLWYRELSFFRQVNYFK